MTERDKKNPCRNTPGTCGLDLPTGQRKMTGKKKEELT